jgi:hypothetical protein
LDIKVTQIFVSFFRLSNKRWSVIQLLLLGLLQECQPLKQGKCLSIFLKNFRFILDSDDEFCLSSDNESDTNVVDSSDDEGALAQSLLVPSSCKKRKYPAIIDNWTHVNNNNCNVKTCNDFAFLPQQDGYSTIPGINPDCVDENSTPMDCFLLLWQMKCLMLSNLTAMTMPQDVFR